MAAGERQVSVKVCASGCRRVSCLFLAMSVGVVRAQVLVASAPSGIQDAEIQSLPATRSGEFPAHESGINLDTTGTNDVLTQLLHWAVEHSDPEKLVEIMRQYQESNLTLKDVYGEDFLESLFVNEPGLMEMSINQIADFRNESVSDESLEAVLTTLLELVEQVDNAGNLHGMGGLEPVLQLATGTERSVSVRTLALWTLGVALQNNAPVQADTFAVNGLELLTALLPRCTPNHPVVVSEGDEFCGKLVFTLSGLVRNNATVQEAADRLGLFDWFLEEGTQYPSLGVVKKALGALDTVLVQNAGLAFIQRGPSERWDDASRALVAHLRTSDVDLAEKALRLVNRIVSMRPFIFKEEFREELASGARAAVQSCISTSAHEVCEELRSLAGDVDMMLGASDIPDDEL